MHIDESKPRRADAEGPEPAAAIERLITEGLFKIAYQPIMDLRREQVVGFEALTRLLPGAGFTSPADLYEAAESASMLWELEGASRGAALQGAREWPEDIQLFMNCAPTVAEDERFESALGAEIQSNRYPAQVVVEITERSPHLDIARLVPRIDALRERGYQIAIDDVGIGASGLVRISSLRPGWLKLDRALISMIDRDRFRWNLVRHLVAFARACGVQVIAEGIERKEELDACRELAICFGQGFLLGKPTFEPLQLIKKVTKLHAVTVNGHDAMPQSAAMLKGVRTPVCIDHSTTLATASKGLMKDPDTPGLCVTREGRLLGWARRDSILRETSLHRRGGAPVSTVARQVPCVELGSVDFGELFELAATHAQLNSDLPILVLSGGLPQALLTTPALLSMAADLARRHARPESQTGGPLTLPGSSACLQHLDSLLSSPVIQSHDAAVVELRGLNAFNHEHGFDAGERLMNHLASAMIQSSSGGFVGHLGMEVYLMTMPGGAASGCLRELVSHFERARDAEPGAQNVNVRAVEVARVTDRFGTSRDVLRYAAARRSTLASSDRAAVILDEPGIRSRSA